MTEVSVGNDPRNGVKRKVGAALGIGIFLLPWIFAWFLLRRGYSIVARVISFGWMAIIILFIIGSSHPAPATTRRSASGRDGGTAHDRKAGDQEIGRSITG